MTWIASAITDEDRTVALEGPLEEVSREGAPYRLRLVAHDPLAYDQHYNVVSNPTLWFIQHGLWDLAAEPELGADFFAAWHEGYAMVNAAFAAAVLEELERRCPARGIPPLTAALRRADRHGAPLAPTLAAQAAEARARRAQAATEAAARAAPQIQLVVALLLVPAVMLLVAAALLPALTGAT